MSVWTHVVGVIRYDSFYNDEPDVVITGGSRNVEFQLAHCNIPCGSEGGLQISKWTNPSMSSIAKYVITIFGDLRDYDDEEEIINYFDEITKGQFVRQANFTIMVEGNKSRVFVWDNETFLVGDDGGFVEVFGIV